MAEAKALFPAVSGTNLPTADVGDKLLAATAAMNLGGGSAAFLKFTKAGAWIYGMEGDEIDQDDVLAVDPSSFTVGWQGWNDGRPVNGPNVSVHDVAKLPKEAELDVIPAGDMNGWSSQLGVSMRTMGEGTSIIYNVTSHGGKKAVTKLMQDIGEGLKAHPSVPVALVKLTGDKYKHKSYGWIHTPVLQVVGWADANGVEDKKLAIAA